MTPHILWTKKGTLQLLDQRLLPASVSFMECATPAQVAMAIRDMVVRGAPAIGIAAAYGMAMGAARAANAQTKQAFLKALKTDAAILKSSRPTAVNLAWAVDLLQRLAVDLCQNGASGEDVAESLAEEATRIHNEDVVSCRAIGQHGLPFVPENARILTHCNAGALATGGYGTALGVVRAAFEAKRLALVYAGETRPYLQGARLTAWELRQDGIPVTIVCDAVAGSIMQRGLVDLVVVGADRIAANGDTANKIGTYSLAVLAAYHKIPFFVAAPRSTFDAACHDGQAIPIEERPSDEVLAFAGTRLAPDGVAALYPAFDVTPASLIQAILTEDGPVQPVNAETVGAFLSKGLAGY